VTASVPRLLAATDDARIARLEFRTGLAALLEAGCPGVWLRAPGLGARELLTLSADVAERCAAHGAALWIGDRADVAGLVGARAVQLPERGLSVAGARRAAGPGVAVGRSVHSVAAAIAAAREGADHLVVGTVYESRTHPGRPAAGPGLVAGIRAALEAAGLDIPLVAIGGMTPARAIEATRAGAAGVAAIGGLWDAPDPGSAARAFLAALRPRPG
jgi:thiamine-phosphate pyrophosphorylase